MNVFDKQQEHVIFQLGIDETSKAHLLETSRWAKFLAILSMIAIGLLILAGIAMTFAASAFASNSLGMSGPFFLILYLVMGVLYFYPVWALLKFSSLIKNALHTSNQQQFNEGLRYQKNMFKFLGVMAIIVLVLYGGMIVFGIIAALVANA